MVKQLAASMKLPIRMLVSYADTEPDNSDNLEAAARLLGVTLNQSDERWVHLVGTNSPQGITPKGYRPQRPAFMLERLRPKDEKPIESPIEYGVFFGTNRRPINPSRLGDGFGNERDNVLHIGLSKVTIPRTHKFGSKGSMWIRWWNWITGKNSKILDSRIFADQTSFADAIASVRVGPDDKPHNLLFVHGFNVTFEAATLQAAHFGVDLKIPGATFAFSWPSAGRIGGYLADEASIEASLPFFEEFVQQVLRHTDNVPLSIVVHSMGNRAVLRYLEKAAIEQASLARGRIQNLIFAAPDVDTDVFKNTIPKILSIPSRTTLYTTRGDGALQASAWMHKYHRAGLAPPVVTAPGLDTVLVEGFNLLDLGHGYYAAASAVLHDFFNLIHHNTEPRMRPGLESTETNEGDQFWKLAI